MGQEVQSDVNIYGVQTAIVGLASDREAGTFWIPRASELSTNPTVPLPSGLRHVVETVLSNASSTDKY